MGLDPNIGFLHEINHSKQPLVYDLQELYTENTENFAENKTKNNENKEIITSEVKSVPDTIGVVQ